MRFQLFALATMTLSCARSSLPPDAVPLTLESGNVVNNSDSALMSGRCQTGVTINVSSDEGAASLACERSRFTYTARASKDGVHVFTFRQVVNGVRHSAVAKWTRDTTAPEIVPETQLTSGGTTTRTRYTGVHVHARDALTQVAAVCVKVESTDAPAPADGCWIALATASLPTEPNANVVLDDLPLQVGFAAHAYAARIWVRDTLGNSSLLTPTADGTEGRDKLSITYLPNPPPVITDVIASATDSPSAPPTGGDLNIKAGDSVVVKWHTADDTPLPSSPVSLYWTQDDATYTLVTSDLANGSNGGCVVNSPSTTFDDADTGCYVWSAGSPSNGYFRVRVVVKDDQGFLSAVSSPPVNAAPVELIAGNTDAGIGASALSAMFFSNTSASSEADSQSVLITRRGTLYYRDIARGLMVVDPKDGVQRVLIPLAAAAVDGPLSQARLVQPMRLTMDTRERLVILDQDRIKRIDFTASEPALTTIIGGGSVMDDEAAALDVKIDPVPYGSLGGGTLVALPNGNVWFQSEPNAYGAAPNSRIRVYEEETGRVRTIQVRGTGDAVDAGVSIENCGFASFFLGYDPATSKVETLMATVMHGNAYAGCTYNGETFGHVLFDPDTGAKLAVYPPLWNVWEPDVRAGNGLDGSVWVMARQTGVARYNAQTNAWETASAYMVPGDCPDGRQLKDCPADFMDVFVDPAGQLTFVSAGRIRTVDSDGTVNTFAGQGVSFGDGGRPTSARIGQIDMVGAYSGKYIVLDVGGGTFREVAPGVSITRIAGNGLLERPSIGSVALNSPIQYANYGKTWATFAVDPVNGDVIYGLREEYMARLVRSSGIWTAAAGNDSSTAYYNDPASDGKDSLTISFTPQANETHPVRVLGYGNNNALVNRMRLLIDRSKIDVFFKTYSVGTTANRQANLAGMLGAAAPETWCADGTALTSCAVADASDYVISQAVYDTTTAAWLVKYNGDAIIKKLAAGSTMQTFAVLDHGTSSFAIRRDTQQKLYYCSYAGDLYARDLNSGVDTKMTWTLPNAPCVGVGLAYETSTHSVLVPFREAGLYGIARIND